jgi:hypothetical protein
LVLDPTGAREHNNQKERNISDLKKVFFDQFPLSDEEVWQSLTFRISPNFLYQSVKFYLLSEKVSCKTIYGKDTDKSRR